jgi:translation initiation factor 2 alpha subunit (eIF-2alpha)
MAVGLPVIASPLPAYQSSPAILCENKEEWQKALLDIFEGRIDLEKVTSEGKAFCEKDYGVEKVKEAYNDMFNHLMLKQR